MVSQYCGQPLASVLEKRQFTTEKIKQIAYQVVEGLKILHEKKMVHRTLSNENILLQENGDIKLFNYGLYYMSDLGTLVSFPVL